MIVDITLATNLLIEKKKKRKKSSFFWPSGWNEIVLDVLLFSKLLSYHGILVLMIATLQQHATHCTREGDG